MVSICMEFALLAILILLTHVLKTIQYVASFSHATLKCNAQLYISIKPKAIKSKLMSLFYENLLFCQKIIVRYTIENRFISNNISKI